MSKIADDLKAFIEYVEILSGDEKGEAQVFCDRLFRAFGHRGYKEAGATLEFRIKKRSTKGTSFADLMWKPRLLLEMKRRPPKPFSPKSTACMHLLNVLMHQHQRYGIITCS